VDRFPVSLKVSQRQLPVDITKLCDNDRLDPYISVAAPWFPQSNARSNTPLSLKRDAATQQLSHVRSLSALTLYFAS